MTRPASSTRGSPIRVLAWPGPGSTDQNRYTPLLYEGVSRGGADVSEFTWTSLLRPSGIWDIWHVHWPETVFSGESAVGALLRVTVLRALIRLARRRGTRVVWTVHNLEAHERRHPVLEARFKEWLADRVDGFISLSAEADRLARERLRGLREKPSAVVPLGHYLDEYPNTVSRLEARAALGIGLDERVFLFFGTLRPYKNIDGLIDAFRRIPDRHVRLVIAGRPGPGCDEQDLVAAAGGDRRIVVHPRAVPRDEVQLYMNAADLVVLPFARILNSASTMLALSFLRPVLVPALPQMTELQERVGSRLVRTYGGRLGPDDLLDALPSTGPDPAELKAAEAIIRQEFDWGTIGARTRELYEEVLRPGARHRGQRAADAPGRPIGSA